MSEANRDEALRCLSISKNKFEDGNSEAAMKFAKKSLSLCETDEGQSWMEFLTKHAAGRPSSSGRPASSSATSTNSLPRKPPTGAAPAEEKPSRPFTPDQTDGIKKIKAMKAKGDLYGVLGLEKGCEESDIKKAYRKLALQYHPDKCGAPGTDEAFKAIGHSFAVLSDPVKKDNYDKFGVDGDASRGGGGGGFSPAQGFGRHGGFGEEISPEELFNMFFGDLAGNGINIHTRTFAAGPQFRRHQRSPFQQQQRQRQPETPQARIIQLLQVLPLLMLILFSLVSTFSVPDESLNENSYSWSRGGNYDLSRTTEIHNINYFVNNRMFDKSYAGLGNKRKLKRFEDAIENQSLKVVYSIYGICSTGAEKSEKGSGN
ncbi:DnaJ (Hsp40), sub B, member 12 [Irineochytrium annulatum]|nr:DnaJ (Hsp40), sub B, member 12 [Irineochytrium annulatum]